MTAAQHNIITVYITDMIYERDTFQKDITKQQFLDDLSVRMLNKSAILYQILIQKEYIKIHINLWKCNLLIFKFYMLFLYSEKYGAPNCSKTGKALQNVYCHSNRRHQTAKICLEIK